MLRSLGRDQERLLAVLGAVVLLIAIMALLLVVANPFGGRSSDRISVAIRTPYVGQGIQVGTAVVMHGVKVGEVTNLEILSGGGVRLAAELRKRPVAGITDSMNIDFRPINFFGVPGVNVIPSEGGQPLRDGTEIDVAPKGNFTFTELLSQLGDVSVGALTPRLITVIDRVTRYTDGLNPLFETLVTITTAVADVQRVSTAQLLANTATISTAFPPFADAAIDAGTRGISSEYLQDTSRASSTGQRLALPFKDGVKVRDISDEPQDYFDNVYYPFLELASTGLFNAVGRVLSSHVDELLPLIDSIKMVTDTGPALLRPDDIALTLRELRSRFEKLYAGNGEQRALQVRIVLDSFPAIAAPLGVAVEGSPSVAALPAEVMATPPGVGVPPIEGSAG